MRLRPFFKIEKIENKKIKEYSLGVVVNMSFEEINKFFRKIFRNEKK